MRSFEYAIRRDVQLNADRANLRPGSPLEIRAFRSDGNVYRWWSDTVVAVDRQRIVTSSPVGRHVDGPGGGWDAWYSGRAVYWFDRPYNLAEIFRPDGSLIEIYVHIASPARLVGQILTYTDHELDVVLKPGQQPEVVDQDEFREAARAFEYTPEFQASCYRAVEEVLDFIGNWRVTGT